VTSQTLELRPRLEAPAPSAERARLERRARLLAWGGNAWHLIEFAIAIGAGIAAGSIALIGFGADSLIEALAGFVIVWLFTGSRLHSETAERRAQQVIAASYFLLAAYVAIASVRDLIGGYQPGVSWVGVGLAAVTAPTMPLLARTKRNVGRQQTQLVGHRQRGEPEHDLRLPLDRAARWPARERALRLVVG
jgi:divalent metal cation (Fe/Co/Zn/Cd) transporter